MHYQKYKEEYLTEVSNFLDKLDLSPGEVPISTKGDQEIFMQSKLWKKIHAFAPYISDRDRHGFQWTFPRVEFNYIIKFSIKQWDRI